MGQRYSCLSCLLVSLTVLLGSGAVIAGTKSNTLPTGSACAKIPENSYPKAFLSAGKVDAVVYLPDPENGSYRSSRFDWSGIVACASYNGHTYFGEWSNNTDPMGNDTVTGPAEEFRRSNSEIGYDEAKPGENFLKVGVGLLKRVDDKPYKFGTVYPIADHGKWTVRVTRRSVSFTQILRSSMGYSYVYEKRLVLDAKEPVMRLEHRLKNLGTNSITTDVYDHDFFVLDGTPTGPGMAITLGFEAKADPPFPDRLVSMSGSEIVFKDTPARGYSAQGYLTGYTGKSGEYRIHVEDRNRQVGVLQTSDSPLSKFYFWSTPRTICPEAYIPIDVAPGKTQRWTISYRFEAAKQ
jgi:hypothetical protein